MIKRLRRAQTGQHFAVQSKPNNVYGMAFKFWLVQGFKTTFKNFKKRHYVIFNDFIHLKKKSAFISSQKKINENIKKSLA